MIYETFTMTKSEETQYGPDIYVIEYFYDNLGRVVKKVVRNNTVQDTSIRYVSAYEFDGMGRLSRETIGRYDAQVERMIVTQDIRTTFDLAGNPTTIVFSDNSGKAYTETRTYARGYQLTNATITTETGVSSSTSGSYTYDTNNNLLTTKQIDVTRGSTQLAFRGNWTFTFDRKNRLKTHSLDGGTSYTDLAYDGLGRVFKRWAFDGDVWSENPMFFVYDGQQLMQEIKYVDGGEQGYIYSQTSHDYLRKPNGIRDKAQVGENYEDRYLLTDKVQITARVKRETTSSVIRQELTMSGDRQSGGSTQDAQISNLGSGGGYIEGYGGGTDTENPEVYFDPLVQFGSRHSLPVLGIYLTQTENINKLGYTSAI